MVPSEGYKMTKIFSHDEIIDVPIGYQCQLEKNYLFQLPKHRRRSPKTWRRVSRVKNITIFKANHNVESLSKEHHLDSEQIMALPFCYNCGGGCPQVQWFEVVE